MLFSNNKQDIPTDFIRRLKVEYNSYGRHISLNKFLKEHLSDLALVWYSIKEKDIYSFEIFEKEFLKKFWGEKYDFQVLEELHQDSYFNHTEISPEEYFTRLVLRAQACSTKLNDSYICQTASRHFGKRVEEMVFHHRITDVERFFDVLEHVGPKNILKQRHSYRKFSEERDSSVKSVAFHKEQAYNTPKNPQERRKHNKEIKTIKKNRNKEKKFQNKEIKTVKENRYKEKEFQNEELKTEMKNKYEVFQGEDNKGGHCKAPIFSKEDQVRRHKERTKFQDSTVNAGLELELNECKDKLSSLEELISQLCLRMNPPVNLHHETHTENDAFEDKEIIVIPINLENDPIEDQGITHIPRNNENDPCENQEMIDVCSNNENDPFEGQEFIDIPTNCENEETFNRTTNNENDPFEDKEIIDASTTNENDPIEDKEVIDISKNNENDPSEDKEILEISTNNEHDPFEDKEINQKIGRQEVKKINKIATEIKGNVSNRSDLKLKDIKGNLSLLGPIDKYHEVCEYQKKKETNTSFDGSCNVKLYLNKSELTDLEVTPPKKSKYENEILKTDVRIPVKNENVVENISEINKRKRVNVNDSKHTQNNYDKMQVDKSIGIPKGPIKGIEVEITILQSPNLSIALILKSLKKISLPLMMDKINENVNYWRMKILQKGNESYNNELKRNKINPRQKLEIQNIMFNGKGADIRNYLRGKVKKK